jgi:hypothetical protein
VLSAPLPTPPVTACAARVVWVSHHDERKRTR